MIAVTGHRGFLGSALINHFQLNAINHVALHGDIRDPDTYASSFDVLIHLAAALPADFARMPIEAEDINCRGTAVALAACRDRGAKMVFSSTCGVYDRKETNPINETAERTPDSPYSASKKRAEDLLLAAMEQNLVPHRILRFFNLYGQGNDRHSVVGYVHRQIISGQTVKIKNPQSRRDFVNVVDAARALHLGATADTPFPVFNIGSGISHSVIEIAQMVANRYGRQDLIEQDNDSKYQDEICADPRRAKSELGWQPMISLEQGIDEICRSISTP